MTTTATDASPVKDSSSQADHDHSWSTNRDGIQECRLQEDDRTIVVQRVPSALLEGSDDDNFDWCNTCNHMTEYKLGIFRHARSLDDVGNNDTVPVWQKIQAWEEAAANWQEYYNGRVAQTQMNEWFPVLGELCGSERYRNTIVLDLSAQHLQQYFQPVSQLAESGGCAKQWYKEEADEFASQLIEQEDALSPNRLASPPPQGWFVRTSSCSPKDAFQDGGSGPHHSLQSVLLALMASDRVHKTMRKQNYSSEIKVYLTPFDGGIDVERELRVFVHENKVRAISQYHVYGSSDVFSTLSSDKLVAVAKQVEEFHTEQVKPRWTSNSSYTMDVEYVAGEGTERDTIRLIELNSFGSEMAAASALFHWERDNQILYGYAAVGENDNADVHSQIYIRVRG